MSEFPLPGMGRAVVAVAAPGAGPGNWAGASSAAADGDGGFVVGYRVRNGHDGIDQTVVARSPDGETFTTVAVLDQRRFGAQWMERPALVRAPEGRWRLYVCCATPESKHWWIDVLEAGEPEGRSEGCPGQNPAWLTPYSACSGVKPSYSSWSIRPERENDE